MAPLPVEAASRRFWFLATQHFHYVPDRRYRGEWKVATDGYAYTLATDEALSHEVVAWHWHPQTRPDPHLHIGRGLEEFNVLPGRAHIPTGRVAFEEVVLFLLKDLGAVPARDDWENVLDDSLQRFRKYRTWP